MCWFVCTLAFPLPHWNLTEILHHRLSGCHYGGAVNTSMSLYRGFVPQPFSNRLDTGRPLALLDTSSAKLFIIEPEPFVTAESSIQFCTTQVSNLRVGPV